MSSILDDILPAVIAAIAVALGQPQFAWAVFAKAFASTLVLTEISKALAPKAPDLHSQFVSRTQTLRTPVGSRQIIYGQIRTGGQLTFAKSIDKHFPNPPNKDLINKVLYLVITFTGHEIEEFSEIWLDDEVIPTDVYGDITGGRFQNWLLFRKRLGTADDTAFEYLVTDCGVTADFRQRGCAKLLVYLSKNNDLYPNGVPNFTAVIKGRKCYDPRTGTRAWTSNAALCIADYLCLPKSSGGLGCDYAADIDETDLITAANVCDENVSLKAGGTEKRYSLNGSFQANVDPQSILQSMLSAMAGTCICIGGKWHIKAGAYVAPTVTLSESHARGPIKTQTRMSRAEIFNGVKGTYTSAANNWQPTDFTPAINATYLAEDSNERLWKDVQYQFTTSHATAQRLAKIELERSRQQITETFPANLAGLQVQAGDTIYRNSTAKGWVNKPFEVTDSKFVIYTDESGNPALGVDLQLRETASTVWDWNTGLETIVDPAPDSALENPFTPAAPGVASVVESLYATTGSAGVKSRATVTLGFNDDGSNPDFSLEYAPTGTGSWTVLPISKNVVFVIDDAAPAVYDFRARAFNALGVASAYSATYTQQLYGLSAPPGNVQNLTVRAIGGQAMITLTQTVDLDVRQGGRLILRWSPKTAGASWNDGSLLGPPDSASGPAGWPGDSVVVMAPLYGGTYLAKFRDSSGNYSVTEATFVVTEALLTGFSTLTTVTESPAFTGTMTNVAAPDGALQLAGATLWDSLGLVDSLGNIDSLGGIVASGNYLFASTMNLGSVKTARLFPAMQSLAFDTADNWDDRTTLIDTWGLVDGAVIEDAEVTLYVRITTDDPTGSPTWGPWHPLPGPADYTFWGAQFRLDFVSGNPTHNRKVTTLAVAAKQ